MSFWTIYVLLSVQNSQSYGFPVVKYGCESWTTKKAEHQRIDAFKLWCQTRLLRVPWIVGRPNQSILKETNSEYSLEGLILKLKLQYFGHLMQRVDSLKKTLWLGKIEGRRRGWQRVRWLDGISKSMIWQALGDSEGWARLGCCGPWGCKIRHNLGTEQQQTILLWNVLCFFHFQDLR